MTDLIAPLAQGAGTLIELGVLGAGVNAANKLAEGIGSKQKRKAIA